MKMQIHLVCGSEGFIESHADPQRCRCKIASMSEGGLPPGEGQLSPHHLSSTHLPGQQGASKNLHRQSYRVVPKTTMQVAYE